jgi:hypothetical protein
VLHPIEEVEPERISDLALEKPGRLARFRLLHDVFRLAIIKASCGRESGLAFFLFQVGSEVNPWNALIPTNNFRALKIPASQLPHLAITRLCKGKSFRSPPGNRVDVKVIA